VILLWIVCGVAAIYQILAGVACLIQLARNPEEGEQPGPASILKPVRGGDAALRKAIDSHLALKGDFELLCGVRPGDPAVALLKGARVVECTTVTPNGKVGSLIDLARAAQHSILIANDADIRVEPDYLRRITAPLKNPAVGLVTCLYRPEGDTLAARFEGLGVATEFAPSVLVGRMMGGQEFAGGSTLAFRRKDLERIGGFEAISSYLADDYQLGRRIRALGLKCELSEVVVTTRLGGGWRDVWKHQVRWARTIRVSNVLGYLSLPVTFATFWVAVAVALGEWHAGLVLLGLRMVVAIEAGWLVIRSSDVWKLWFLIPFRDLFGVAVWVAGLIGSTVEWGGQRMRLDAQGRILDK
jgi:ceramide glucosyltransferase